MLRSLTAADAAEFHELLRASAEHLSRFADYREAVTRDVRHWVQEFSLSDPDLDFAIYEDETMVGRAALNPAQVRLRLPAG